jgi:hypothetical protein
LILVFAWKILLKFNDREQGALLRHIQRHVTFCNLTGVAYAAGFDGGGARGERGLSDNRGIGAGIESASGVNSSVGRKTRKGVLIITGSASIFTKDCSIVRAEVFSSIARRIGLGLSGREKSGALIPTKTMNNGTTTVTKRIHRLCFTNLLMLVT